MNCYTQENIIKSHLETATSAAQSAGHLLMKSRNDTKVVLDDSGRDTKLEIDIRSEEIVIDFLQKHTPYSIFSEEKGRILGQDNTKTYCWVVDPLDGSVNFFQGIPLCCVSVGLYEGQTPVLGVVYDFLRDDLYQGILGQGAWLNEKPIRVSSNVTYDKSILCTGFPVATDFSREAIKSFTLSVRRFKKIRLLGSAALSLAFVAAGKADAYYERDIKIWDVAAGIALVKAAGGRVLQAESNIPNAVTVFAANSKLPIPDLSEFSLKI